MRLWVRLAELHWSKLGFRERCSSDAFSKICRELHALTFPFLIHINLYCTFAYVLYFPIKCLARIQKKNQYKIQTNMMLFVLSLNLCKRTYIAVRVCLFLPWLAEVPKAAVHASSSFISGKTQLLGSLQLLFLFSSVPPVTSWHHHEIHLHKARSVACLKQRVNNFLAVQLFRPISRPGRTDCMSS